MARWIVGPLVVLTLGLAAGVLLVTPRRTLVPWRLLAAVLASLAWIAGVYVLLALTAPKELAGPPLLLPLLWAFLTALAGSLAGALLRRCGARSTG